MNGLLASLTAAAALIAIAYGIAMIRRADVPTLRNAALPLAGAIAATSMAGSLYYSEIAGYVPCELCWYQRIAMYPLAIILVIAAVRKDTSVIPYGLVLSLTGAVVSAYHYIGQAFPATSACDIDASCAFQWVNVAGFISIPLMALVGFLAIASTLTYRKINS